MSEIKKVLLVFPPASAKTDISYYHQLLEPLALEYIAAAIPEQEVRIQDMRLEPNLKRTLTEFKPDMVGFTAFTCHVNTVKNLAVEVKALTPNVPVLVGGHHATIMPEDFDIPQIDIIVMGEGCGAFKEIMDSSGKLEGVLGVAYRKGGQLFFNQPRLHPPLDDLPFPRRDLIAKYKSEYHLYHLYDMALMRTSSGCPYRCKFCALWHINKGRYLARDISKVIEEIKSIDSKRIFFADDESMLEYSRMMELAKSIKEENIKKGYLLYARCDTVIEHPDLFKAWKEIGLEMVFMGYESFSNERLRKMNKGETIEIQQKATIILKDLNIPISAFFLADPDYDYDDFISLKKYIRRLDLRQPSIVILTPLPGTKLFEERYNEITTFDWDYYDFTHSLLPTKLSLDEFNRMYIKTVWSAISYKNKFLLLLKYPLRKIIPRLWLAIKDRIVKQRFWVLRALNELR